MTNRKCSLQRETFWQSWGQLSYCLNDFWEWIKFKYHFCILIYIKFSLLFFLCTLSRIPCAGIPKWVYRTVHFSLISFWILSSFLAINFTSNIVPAVVYLRNFTIHIIPFVTLLQFMIMFFLSIILFSLSKNYVKNLKLVDSNIQIPALKCCYFNYFVFSWLIISTFLSLLIHFKEVWNTSSFWICMCV